MQNLYASLARLAKPAATPLRKKISGVPLLLRGAEQEGEGPSVQIAGTLHETPIVHV